MASKVHDGSRLGLNDHYGIIKTKSTKKIFYKTEKNLETQKSNSTKTVTQTIPLFSPSNVTSHWNDLLPNNNGGCIDGIGFSNFRLYDRSHILFEIAVVIVFTIVVCVFIIYVQLYFPRHIHSGDDRGDTHHYETSSAYQWFTTAIQIYFYISVINCVLILLLKLFKYVSSSTLTSTVTPLLSGDHSTNDKTLTMAGPSNNNINMGETTNNNQTTYINQLTSDRMECWLENIGFHLLVGSIQLYVIYLVFLRQNLDDQFDDESLPSEHSLPEGVVAGGLFSSICLYLVFKHVSFRIAFIMECSVFLINMTLVLYWQLSISLPRLLLGFAVAIFILSEYHRQVWYSFQFNQKLERTIQENQRLADEVKSTELRHMIGNVAHDLKTPLSSFISGMEVIQKVSNELRDDLNSLNKTSKLVLEKCKCQVIEETKHCLGDIYHAAGKVSTILEVAENVTNTNAFMIMTINRCIDYNKTLFGLKLSPKPEVFLLKDCMDFTINCLKNSYDQVSIACEYISEGLSCGDIMLRTDKQWLQENLLCLVGNAAKYSELIPSVDIQLSIETSQSDAEPQKERRTSYLKINVADHGPGIDPGIAEKLFLEPTQAARLTGGTGLGLYSLARRVDTLGGRYGIDDRSDGQQGCSIWFTVPLIMEADSESVQASLMRRAAEQKSISRRSIENSFKSEAVIVSEYTGTRIETTIARDHDPKNSLKESSIQPAAIVETELTHTTRTVIPVPEQLSPSAASTPMKVLVVDDSTVIRKMTSLSLEKHGYQVTTAVNGLEAVNIYREALQKIKSTTTQETRGQSPRAMKMKMQSLKAPFDAILMDFQMPVMDGLGAIAEIRMCEEQELPGVMSLHAMGSQRSFGSSKNLKLDNTNKSSFHGGAGDNHGRAWIIGFSAKSDEAQIDEGFEKGMNAFLPKPFTIALFESLLNR